MRGYCPTSGVTDVATAEAMIRAGTGYYDPYDHWATGFGVRVRHAYYRDKLVGKVSAAIVVAADWVGPLLLRRMINASPRLHPITAAHLVRLVLDGSAFVPTNFDQVAIDLFDRLAARGGRECPWMAWGLGFQWMSKNGLYSKELPFITHTPYVMEALLALVANRPDCEVEDSGRSQARAMFNSTWGFLQSLLVMHRDTDSLALSYSPVVEPRIVVNANTYAAFAYALHATHGAPHVRQEARAKAISLCRWVARQQNKDGSWFYFADDLAGNFIDGFHSCIVLRNLNKTAALIPEVQSIVGSPVERGWRFMTDVGFDSQRGLCRRFIVRDFRDPYPWDIYDQAEYLGLLIDFGQIEEATKFREHVKRQFCDDGNWWCRIDVLGRRWGRNFLRWGIVPFWYHSARLDRVLQKAA